MKIQLKRSNVLSGGSAKEPTVAQMEYGEIAVNYNESDPVLFIKDSSDNIVRIAGANSSGGFDGDYENLTNKPTIGDGEITIKSGGVEVGTFTVNQEGTTEIDIPVASWGDIDEKPIYIDTDAPDSPSNGDLWVDLNECPPELKIWSDCSGTGQWEGIEGTPALAVLTPVLSGNPAQDEVLTSTLGQAVGGKEPFIYVYNFQDENDNVLQATAANTYTLVSADVGKTVTVSVTATDSRGTVETSSKSNAIGPIVPPEEVNAPTLLTPANSSTDLSVNSITLTCSAYSGVESVYASTTWQVSTVADFSSTVYDVTNSNQTSNAATFSPALEYEGTYYARCKHTSSNGIASDFSNVNTFTTEADPVDNSVPSATMSGLRFDKNRNSYMLRGKSGQSDTFTHSFWIKPTYSEAADIVVYSAKETSARIAIQNSTGYVIINNSGTGADTVFGSIPVLENTWSHIVVSTDGTGSFDVSVNGVTETITASGSNLSTRPYHALGIFNTTSVTANHYLSEYFFVDGEALEPTTFGKTFPDGRWGPLDSSIITDNISNSVVQPYDQRANTDEVWSAGTVTGNFANDYTNVFDGDLTTEHTQNGGNASDATTLTLTNPIPVNGAKVEYYAGGSATNGSVTFNSTNQVLTTVNSWVEVSGFSDAEITSITCVPGASTLQLKGIRVGGRLLVDNGVWNATQNWSSTFSSTTGFATDSEPGNAFNGIGPSPSSVPAGSRALSKNGGHFVWDVSGFNLQGELSIASSTDRKVIIDGVLFNPGTFDTYGSYRTVTTVNNPSEIIFTGVNGTIQNPDGVSGSSAAIWGIKLDGTLLIDAGEQWNISQIWSGFGSSKIDNPQRAFSGVVGTGQDDLAAGLGSSTEGSFTFTKAVSSTVEISSRGFMGENAAIYVGTQLLGTASSSSNGYEWTSFNFTGTIDATTPLKIENNETSKAFQFNGIRIDGVLLVDKGSVGANGFYLPFDPTNTGANYSSGLTGFDSATPAVNAFDGDLGKSCESALSGTLTYTGSIKGNLKLYRANGGANAGDCTVNVGSGEVNFARNSWVDFGTVDISSFTIKDTSGASAALSGVMVDDVLLVDHSSIGVDASGNKNHFHDPAAQNFSVPSNFNTSKDWMSGVVSTNIQASTPIENLFNGVINASVFPNPNTGNCTITFPAGHIRISAGDKLELRNVRNHNDSIINLNGVNYSGTLGNLPTVSGGVDVVKNVNMDDITSAVDANGDLLTMEFQYDTSTQSVGITGLFINGKQLVLPNPSQIDTVTDTPLMSYAVLESGTNGNLNGTTAQNSTVSIGTDKIYLESTAPSSLGPSGDRHHVGIYSADGTQKGRFRSDGNTVGFSTSGSYSWSASDLVGFAYDASTGKGTIFVNGTEVVTGTSTFASDPDDRININGANEKYTVNFGQQPFVASNVTYNQATGKVTIGSDTYDTLFDTWDEYATFGLFVYDANQGKAIRTFELNKTYGIKDVLTAANIFRLTAQPRYTVISYIENNGEYLPLEDVSEQLIAANATIASLQYELDATQTELATASTSIATGLTARAAIEVDVDAILARLSGLEADEIVDDATDTTLLTAFASLVARVEALENP